MHAWFQAGRGCHDADILITIISKLLPGLPCNRIAIYHDEHGGSVLPSWPRPACSWLCSRSLIVFLHPPYHLPLHCHPIRSVDAVLCLRVSAGLSSMQDNYVANCQLPNCWIKIRRIMRVSLLIFAYTVLLSANLYMHYRLRYKCVPVLSVC